MAAALLLVASSFARAADPQLGRWALDVAKSKLDRWLATEVTVVQEAVGDKVRVVADGVDATGKKTRSEWTGKYDGKDYRVTGDPTADSRALAPINERTLALTVKKNGKVTLTGRIAVAPDGRSRTVVVTGTDANGVKFKSAAYYERKER
jgi:hypothetical protein